MDEAKLEALRLAIVNREINYDKDGKMTGTNADKVLEAAKKYYEWIKA